MIWLLMIATMACLLFAVLRGKPHDMHRMAHYPRVRRQAILDGLGDVAISSDQSMAWLNKQRTRRGMKPVQGHDLVHPTMQELENAMQLEEADAPD